MSGSGSARSLSCLERTLPVAAVALLFLAGNVIADRDSAVFFSSRGDKALKDKDWTAAEENFTRALQEDETYFPARFGLAEALLGAQKRAAAVEAFRLFVQECEKSEQSKETADLLEKARKRLKEIDEAGSALEAIIDDHVTELVALARKWQNSDPQIFETILRRVLKLRPGHAAATSMLEKTGKSATSVTSSVFNGRDLTGWNMGFPIWQVKDGMIIAELRDSCCVGRSECYCKGDFDVLVEMKCLEEKPGPPLFGLLAGYRGDYNNYTYGFLRGLILWEDNKAQGAANRRTILQKPPTTLKKHVDPFAWNCFELRFRGKEVTAFVNGEEVGKDVRPPERDEGFIGLVIQNAKVAFRKIEVTQR